MAGVSAATTASRRSTTKLRIGKVAMMLEDYNERWGTYPRVSFTTDKSTTDPRQWRPIRKDDLDNDVVYSQRNREVIGHLMGVEEYKNDLLGFGDAAINTEKFSSTVTLSTLLDGFDQPIRFDGSILISSSDASGSDDLRTKNIYIPFGNHGQGNRARYRNEKIGKIVAWSTGYDEVENLATDDSGNEFAFIYRNTVVDQVDYRPKHKNILMPVGDPNPYVVPYRPNPEVAGDDIFNVEDTQR